MTTSTRVVPSRGNSGAVVACTISCLWCTITSIWRDARRMNVALKGCNPNRASRSARNGPSSPSARSACAAFIACRGGRGLSRDGWGGAKGSDCELTATTSAVIVVPSASCASNSMFAAACKGAKQVNKTCEMLRRGQDAKKTNSTREWAKERAG
eukprot:scaffold9302_cov56-Phaeocystis_antarctica.AAC.1